MIDGCIRSCIMRSELLSSVDKYKLTSEMPSGRRKLQTTKAPPQLPLLLNGESSSSSCPKVSAVNDAVDEGDFSDNNRLASSAKSLTEVNMVAAMQDHISCTKLKSSSSASGLVVGDVKDLTKMTFELDHMYANCSSGVRLNSLAASLSPSTASSVDEHPASDDDAQQIQCLKELLVLHLDLISQEQEKSNLKDLQIEALKKENEALKQQLSEVEKCRLKNERKLPKRGGGRAAAAETDSESGGGGSSSCRWRERNANSRRNLDRRRKRDDSQLEEHFREQKKQRRRSGGPGGGGGCGTVQQQEEKSSGLSTDIVYYTPVGEVTRLDDNLDVFRPIVQVPGWRIKVVTSCYQMEGTENLDDDLYLKRHQKLETDEKRRKRWDIQRLRDQRMQEKLRLGRQANKKTNPTKNSSVQTFYPNVDDVQTLEVSEVLPVTAFGRQVGKAEASEFTLPWMTG